MSLNLKSLQTKMVEAIVDLSLEAPLRELIEPGGELPSAEQALKVYQAGYPARLTEALSEAYEAVWSVLGDEDFFAVCERFIRHCHSRSYNLTDYDERFAAFLAAQPELCADLPFLAELAAWEWDFHCMFHLRGDEAVTWAPEELAKINETSRFCFISSLKLFSFEYRSYDIWKQRQDQERSVFDFRQPQRAAMYKMSGGPIQTMLLNEWQFATLSALLNGRTLAESLEDAPDEQAVSQLFSLLIQHSWLSDIATE